MKNQQEKEQEKKRILGKLLLCFITTNLLSESLDEELVEKKLFKRQTKFNAKNLLESLEKDIEPLYKSLQTGDSIKGYTEMFNLISDAIKQITEEVIANIEL